MDDVLTIINKIGGASFATLLALILWGSYKEVWMWRRERTEMEARHKAAIARLEDDLNWWRNIAVKATGIAEVQGQVIRVKESKEQGLS